MPAKCSWTRAAPLARSAPRSTWRRWNSRWIFGQSELVVVVVDGLWLVVLWWWTLGIVERLLMNFDVGDTVQTIGPKVELTLSDWLLGILA